MSGTSDKFDELEIIEDLARRAARGDKEAFKRLLEYPIFRSRFKRVCKIIAKRRGVDPDELEEQAYERLLKGIHQFQSKSTFMTWSSAIIQNIAVDLLRQKMHRERTERAQESLIRDAEFARDGGEDDLVSKLDMENAMSKLSVIERRILRLRFWKGCTIAEIASLLGLTPKQVNVRVENCLKKLADMLISHTVA